MFERITELLQDASVSRLDRVKFFFTDARRRTVFNEEDEICMLIAAAAAAELCKREKAGIAQVEG